MFTRPIAVAACAAALLCVSAAPAGATTAHADVARTSVVVGGTPFFPIMLIDQCSASDTARARTLGVNLILNESCPGVSPADQLGQLASGELGVLPIQARGTDGTRLAGWTFPDEPENNGWTPSRLEQAFPYRRGTADGLISFITMTGGFFRPPDGDPKVSPALVRAFTRLADVAGFDLYPLNHCQSDLASVYEAQRAFARLADGRPTFQWIETGPLDASYCGGFQMTSAQLRAEAWLAVVGGARAIGFFTHTVKPAGAFGASRPVAHAIQRFASLAGAVKPGLVGTTTASASSSTPVKVLARVAGSRTYVFAVNAAAQPVRAQLDVPRLTDGGLRVFGEKRSVAVSGHRLTDTFGPFAVHLYVR